MELWDRRDVKPLLEKEGFFFKKSLGQNFLVDGSVAPRMAELSCDKDTGVIEVGPGAGVLTRELSARARRVAAIEIDEKLKPVLARTLKDCENVKLIFGDVLKTDLRAVIKDNFGDCGRVTVCANLPYYITSPVITGLLKQNLPVESVTVMVQKEAGERICARVGTRKAGALTALINYYAIATPLFSVPREAFLPAPKVDSEVIRLEIRKEPPVDAGDEEFFFKTVNACFLLRRKTAINSLASAFGADRETLREIFAGLGIAENTRGESFTMDMLARLSKELKKHLQNG